MLNWQRTHFRGSIGRTASLFNRPDRQWQPRWEMQPKLNNPAGIEKPKQTATRMPTNDRDSLVPQTVTSLRTGYSPADFRDDALAGLTVAILAIPLSMAIAIGSGADPSQGLITTIIAGFLISALGGSLHQVGGPAAAFIVIVGGIATKYGIDGMLTATFLAGLILVIAGAFRLGSYITYVPGPVILGFTSAVGILITVGQLKDFFGLTGDLPADMLPKLKALWLARGTINPSAFAIGALTIAIILGIRRFAPKAPGLLIAVVAASLVTWALDLPVLTIGQKFGTTLSGLPMPHLPNLAWSKVMEVLPTAFTLAFLIGVESLLSAVAADAITGTRHRSNAEVLAQGVANMASPLFGGLPATGVIARTGTNIAAGAKTPVAGMMHALFVLLSVLLLGGLTAYLPLACLAGVLLTVAWRLIDVHEMVSFIRRAPRDDVVVLLATWILTIFEDLNTAIAVGVVLAALFLMHRLAESSGATSGASAGLAAAGEERRSIASADQRPSPWRDPLPDGVKLLDFNGPMFFGQASRMADVLKGFEPWPKVLIMRMRDVPLIDATAIGLLDDLAADCRKKNCRIIISSLQAQPRSALHRYGFLKSNRIILVPDGFKALEKARELTTP
jgi:SulP family sulfate permease